MTRRAQIEAVLNQHKVIHGYGSILVSEELLEALCACWPQPSREELEKVLIEQKVCRESVHKRSGCLEKPLVDALMAWASGQEPKRWCEHMDYDNGHWTLKDRTWSIPSGMTWQYCPLCAKERPSDA